MNYINKLPVDRPSVKESAWYLRRYWWLFPVIAHLLLLLSATYFPVLNHPDIQKRPGHFWFQWDSLYYVIVAKLGYTHIPGIYKYKNVAFFPFVPMLVRFLGAWGVLLLEQVTFAICVVLLKGFGERMGLTRAQAIKGTWLFALCPAAIYFSAIYAEPWTLFGALLSLFFATRERWLLAALMGLITSMTQGTGILFGLLPLVLFFYAMLQHDFRLVRKSLIWGIGCALGLFIYMAYLGISYHDPLAFSSVQSKMWHSYWRWPWFQFIRGIRVGGLSQHKLLVLIYECVAGIYGIGAVMMCLNRGASKHSWEEIGAKVYVVVGLLVAFSFYAGHRPFYSTIRIAAIYFPMYIGLSKRLPNWLFWVVVICFACIAYVGASRFTHGYFFQ